MIKLNCGSDTVVLPKENGWINFNLTRVHPDIVVLDVRTGIPYANDSVDEVYGGNFFDHLDYYEGIRFLIESRRVLKQGCSVKLSLMDTDRIINNYLYDKMNEYNNIQPQEYNNMKDKSLKFATFLLGNLATGQTEYTGHRMLYTPASIMEIGNNLGFTVRFPKEDEYNQEPWSTENKKFLNHCFYVELIKGEK